MTFDLEDFRRMANAPHRHRASAEGCCECGEEMNEAADEIARLEEENKTLKGESLTRFDAAIERLETVLRISDIVVEAAKKNFTHRDETSKVKAGNTKISKRPPYSTSRESRQDDEQATDAAKGEK